MKLCSSERKGVPARPRTVLTVERLEDRLAPVLGNGGGPPAPIAAGGTLAGGVAGEFDHVVHTVVANGGNATGALLSTQRHILTAGHAMDGTQTNINFHMMRTRGNQAVQVPITFTLPADNVMNRWQVRHPNYAAGLQIDNDIGIFRLTDQANPAADRYVIAPVGLNNLRGYGTSAMNPVGLTATFVGYGETGTGNWGTSADAVQTLTFNMLPAAGAANFTLTFTRPAGAPGPAAQTTANIDAVALTARDLAIALEALPALAPVGQNRRVEVHRWGPTSFSIRFIGPNIGGRVIAPLTPNVPLGQGGFNIPPVRVDWAGGFSPAKRVGKQEIDRIFAGPGVQPGVAANYVEADFDSGANPQNTLGGLGLADEGMLGLGDSGGPAFRRTAANSLEIIGINQVVYRTTSPPDINNWIYATGASGPRDSSFGEFSVFTAVHKYNQANGFIDTTINNQPYDLILDMSKQVIGADQPGENVAINIRRVAANLVIDVTDPLNAYSGEYYKDALARIRALTFRGTADNETVTHPANLFGPNQNPRIIPGGGNDKTNIVRLEAGGGGDLIAVNSGDGDDTLTIEDQLGNAGLNYLVSATSILAEDLNVVEYDGTENLDIFAAGLDDTVTLNGVTTAVPGLITINGGSGRDRVVIANGFVSTDRVSLQLIEDLDVNADGFSLSGLSETETFTVPIDYKQTSAGKLYLELRNPGWSDQLRVGGTVTLGGTLVLNTLPNFGGAYFVLIDNYGSSPVSGTFAGLPEGAVVALGGQLFFLSYVGGTGNDVVLTGFPALTINDVSLSEGNSGTTTFTFTVSLSAPSPQTVTVNYATADGTATTANYDYVATSGMLTFSPGQTSKTIEVSVIGDTTIEDPETFFVNLSNAVNAPILDSQGVGNIGNDDVGGGGGESRPGGEVKRGSDKDGSLDASLGGLFREPNTVLMPSGNNLVRGFEADDAVVALLAVLPPADQRETHFGVAWLDGPISMRASEAANRLPDELWEAILGVEILAGTAPE